jgi:ubiquinone/menaquinone biosynthesis C-methylase UbiE
MALSSPAYDARAETRAYFETHNRPHWFANNTRKFAQRTRDELSLLDPQPRDTVLEIGTARGDATTIIAPRVRRLVGVDIAPAALEVARERLNAAGIANVDLVADDASHLSRIAARSVDKAFAYDLIEHIADDALVAMLEATARVVRVGGTLSLYTPCGSHYVEVLRRWHVLPSFREHIAVRTTAHTLRLIDAVHDWTVDALWHSPSCYPLFGWIDRALYRVPGAGALFRHKICLRLRRVEQP